MYIVYYTYTAISG